MAVQCMLVLRLRKPGSAGLRECLMVIRPNDRIGSACARLKSTLGNIAIFVSDICSAGRQFQAESNPGCDRFQRVTHIRQLVSAHNTYIAQFRKAPAFRNLFAMMVVNMKVLAVDNGGCYRYAPFGIEGVGIAGQNIPVDGGYLVMMMGYLTNSDVLIAASRLVLVD